MKICHMEAMKEIRALEEKKNILLANESTRCRVSYKEGEEKVDTGYSFEETRAKLSELDGKVRHIRRALAYANCTVMLDEFGVTIGEGLVMLAQWNAEYSRLFDMSMSQKITRRITQNGTLEYTECLYDPENAAERCDELKHKIGSLQVAIDRANLLNSIEI